MKNTLKSIWSMLVETAKSWSDADPWRQSAIISYYAIFSIPGLLMIVIWIAGAIFGEQAVRGEIGQQVESYMGPKAATGIEQMLANTNTADSALLMKIVGIGALVFGATTLFFQLQKSLNYMWEVEADPENNLKKLLKDRAFSLGLIVVIAFLLLITLVVTAVLSMLGDYIEDQFGEAMLSLVQLANFLVSLGIITFLFAIIYKVLPDVDIKWKSVWVGALVTAILFTIGKTLLGLYFGIANPGDSFGAAGTIILVMLWINYSCLILFFGAEFTQVYARRYGFDIRPSSHAKWRAEYLMQQSEETDSAVEHRH